jgi:hypothetical protein
MGLIKEQRILTDLKNNKNIRIISIITTSDNFNKRFDCISAFFKSLKNSLSSIHLRTNREVMKGLTGVYFSLEMGEEFQILIVYDSSVKALNNLDTAVRLKKLLGLKIKLEFGNYDDFEPVIKNMFGIRRKIQPFGDYYFNSSRK